MNIVFKPAQLDVSIGSQSVGVSTGTPIAREYVDREPFTGEYTVIPTTEQQILETKNLRMTNNITVEAIPTNYGLITWDGITLTVS